MQNCHAMRRFLRILITSADTTQIINKLRARGILIFDVEYGDLLTVSIWIKARDYKLFSAVMKENGTQYQVTAKKGIFFDISSISQRLVLIGGLLMFTFLTFQLPSRILFVQVEGNSSISTNLILEKAEESGITFWCNRRDVRSESVKNALLSKIPELQWVGINTQGCVARLVVKESNLMQNSQQTGNRVSAIVASRDGIIEQITVLRGTPIYSVGQAVKQGDILISGYTDCGLKITAENAQGEIFAYTNRDLQVIALKPTVYKGEKIAVHNSYRIRIGKKEINLWKHSGIPNTIYDKMYKEKYLTLPGGFQLPIALVKVTYIDSAATKSVRQNEENNAGWLAQFARRYLGQQMIAGSILKEKADCQVTDTYSMFNGTYACHEMIGQVRYEETLEENAKDN